MLHVYLLLLLVLPSSGLTTSNLDSFTQAVDFLQAESLLSSLLNYLESSIDETNYVRYYEIARQLVSKPLLDALDKFFLDNFDSLSRSSTQINQLSADDLYRLLSDDRLDVDNELRLVNLIFRWVKRDPKNRRSQLPRLMSTVRCVRAEFLTKSQVKQYIQLKNQMKTREDDELVKEICREYQAAIESLRNCIESHFDESGNPIYGLDESYELNEVSPPLAPGCYQDIDRSLPISLALMPSSSSNRAAVGSAVESSGAWSSYLVDGHRPAVRRAVKHTTIDLINGDQFTISKAMPTFNLPITEQFALM